jgi:hypothetical protein
VAVAEDANAGVVERCRLAFVRDHQVGMTYTPLVPDLPTT